MPLKICACRFNQKPRLSNRVAAVAVRPFQVDPDKVHKIRDLPSFLQFILLHQNIEGNNILWSGVISPYSPLT